MTRREMLQAAGAAVLAAGAGSAARAAERSLSGQLAQAIVALRGTTPPPEVIERTIWTVIDNLGAMIFAGRTREVQPYLDLATSRTGAPAARIVGTGRTAPVEAAAGANAFLIHANEVDDGDLRSQLRASAVIMSSAMAIAEAFDVSGPAFLKACALGYTVQGRLAAPLGPTQGRGWMASGVWGPPAAAAMAADMLGLDAAKITSAIGLAGVASGGPFQYFYDQTEEKRLIVARAARAAVESALLARAGEVGASQILEGPAGLYRLIGGPSAPIPTAEALTADLARLEGPLFIRPKYFAASHSIIPTLDGMAEDTPGLKADQIESFLVRGDAGWARVLAAKVDRFEAPATRIGAMMNFSYVLALVLVRGRAMPADFDGPPDPAAIALAGKGRFAVEPERRGLRVEFRLKDGRLLTAEARYPGPDEQAPPEEARRLAKFRALTADRLAPANQDRVMRHCRTLPEAGSMRAWAGELQSLLSG
ncbi:hypothetical protein GVN21_15805 [Caulobacter sp. SLTY]|uniref:MmgE/PrpD family protein n=1 Tax=Caulobacter sp. SLTY TaxID=2683262 RepID=UPI001413773E|nr:hypothetical protein [Caulobacter sp. SLTY]